VQRALARYRSEGTSVVGLGGLVSVITRNGLSVYDPADPMIVTTGNTYTTALAAEAVVRTAIEKGLSLRDARVGIVGAGGNIGSILLQVLGRHFRHMTLVGRKQSIGRVEAAALANYGAVAARLARSGGEREAGLAGAIAEAGLDAVTGNAGGDDCDGAQLRQQLIERFGADPFVTVTSELSSLGDCDIVVSASNAVAPILTPDIVGPRTRIICDVSVPSDVHPDLVATRADIAFIRGGVARAPDGNAFHLDFIDLPPNHMLACMAETAILALSGERAFNCVGDIDPAGVEASQEVGRGLGFSLGYSSDAKPVPLEIDRKSTAAE